MSTAEEIPREVAELADRIRTELARAPRFFAEIVGMVPEGQHRTLLRAWGFLRRRGELVVNPNGRYTRKAP